MHRPQTPSHNPMAPPPPVPRHPSQAPSARPVLIHPTPADAHRRPPMQLHIPTAQPPASPTGLTHHHLPLPTGTPPAPPFPALRSRPCPAPTRHASQHGGDPSPPSAPTAASPFSHRAHAHSLPRLPPLPETSTPRPGRSSNGLGWILLLRLYIDFVDLQATPNFLSPKPPAPLPHLSCPAP